VAIRAPICLTRTSKFLSLMNPLLTQMLGESVSVEIQARGVDIDADRAAVAEQIDITSDDIRSERHGRMRCVGPIDHTPAGVSPGVTPEKAAGRGSGAPCARATRLQPRASPKFSS
jgi:hypothetical protein